jgi:hypothetical protein
MNEQINLRMPATLAKAARAKAKAQGYGTVQEYIEEAVREKIEDQLTPKELQLVERIIKMTDERKEWGTEEELWAAFKKKAREKSKKARQ